MNRCLSLATRRTALALAGCASVAPQAGDGRPNDPYEAMNRNAGTDMMNLGDILDEASKKD